MNSSDVMARASITLHDVSTLPAHLAVFLAFFPVAMLAAHLAGARNMLQFMGVLCLATGSYLMGHSGTGPS